MLRSRRAIALEPRFIKRDGSPVPRLDLKPQPLRFFRKKIGKAIRPFDHRHAIAEQIIIKANPRERLRVFHPKKIKVINRQHAAGIFVHDGKCGAGHFDLASQTGRDTLDVNGFPAPQFTGQSQNGSWTKFFGMLPAQRLGLSRAVGNERSHEANADCGFQSVV